MKRSDFDQEMFEQQQDGWLDDYEYGFCGPQAYVDPAFNSHDDVNAMTFLRHW